MTTGPQILDAILAELSRPSDMPPGPLHRAYERAVIGIGHLVLGAALAGLLWPVAGWLDASLRLACAIAYFLFKELGDIRRGGGWRDSIEDAACVGLGLFYAGQWFAPGAAIGIGAYLMWRGARAA